MKQDKKLFVLKYEVMATNIRTALDVKQKRLYEITEAAPEFQPEKKNKKVGFTK